jgi:homoserine kinase
MLHVPAGHEIAVPGSSANLGAGFDAFGLALQVFLVLRIREVDDRRRGELAWTFTGDPPSGENYIERAFRAGVADGRDWPSLHVEVSSAIPMKSGLGSSAAAIVAGLRLAALVADRDVPTQRLLDTATALEGHPDNVSASLLGGFTTSAIASDGHVISRAVAWPKTWRVVVATPAVEVATKDARAALPAQVPLADAVANLQRAALLVHAVHTADTHALREALRDRLHQPYRARLVPGLERALDLPARGVPGLLGTFLSGAGPSIAALVEDEGHDTMAALQDLYRELRVAVAIRAIPVHPASGQGNLER